MNLIWCSIIETTLTFSKNLFHFKCSLTIPTGTTLVMFLKVIKFRNSFSFLRKYYLISYIRLRRIKKIFKYRKHDSNASLLYLLLLHAALLLSRRSAS